MDRKEKKEKKEQPVKPVNVHITNHNKFEKGVGAFITNLNHLTIVMDSEGNMKLNADQVPAPVMPQTEVEEESKEDDNAAREQGKAAIMEYVGRLKPLVVSNMIGKYDEVWLRILELDEVKCMVYDRGRQQNTTFNRNFVANIIHLMRDDGMYLPGTNDVTMAEYLEPQKGKEHPVRGSLGLSPENKVKMAIEKVFQAYLRESS